MAASQVALWEATGRLVIVVFHTALAGNDGQSVPGRVGPGRAGPETLVPPAPAAAGPAANTSVTASAGTCRRHQSRRAPSPGLTAAINYASLPSGGQTPPALGRTDLRHDLGVVTEATATHSS